MRKARLLVLLMVVALTALSLTGCPIAQLKTATATAATTTTHTTAEDQYTWQGTIIEIYEGGTAFLAAVDTDYQTMLGDKASVSLYDDAIVVRDDTGEAIDLASVPVSTAVIVTITGGIRESYPVQVSAIEVRVILAD